MDEQELRGKDGKLCGKVRDKRYLVIRRGKRTEVFDLKRIVDSTSVEDDYLRKEKS